MLLTLENIRYKNILNIDKFQFDKGQFYSINGPNGAGKSTLLKILTGEIIFSGKVTIYEKNLFYWKNKASKQLAKNMAILPQSSHINFDFTAKEIVELGLIPLTIKQKDAVKIVKKVMLDCDCFHLAEQSILTLSGGEKQRIHLARVLIQLSQAEQAPILLLDEPTSAQDLAHQHLILELLNSLVKQSYTVISVLHDINHSIQYCNKTIVIKQGKIVDYGKPKELFSKNFIENNWQYRPQQVGNYFI